MRSSRFTARSRIWEMSRHPQNLVLRLNLPPGFNNTDCGTDSLWAPGAQPTTETIFGNSAWRLSGDVTSRSPAFGECAIDIVAE